MNYVIFVWGLNHINAMAAISNSAGTYLYFQISYTFLVDCLEVRGLF